MRPKQALNQATMSPVPYTNEVISDSMGYQNGNLALHNLTFGTIIRFPPTNFKRGWGRHGQKGWESPSSTLVFLRTIWELGAFWAATLLPCPLLTKFSSLRWNTFSKKGDATKKKKKKRILSAQDIGLTHPPLKDFSKTLQSEFPSGPVVKNSPGNPGDTGSIPGSGRSHRPRGN